MSNEIIVNTDILQVGHIGPVYRFFDEEIHADNFCKGIIRISTLEACRGYENPEQGDAGEASWLQSIGSLFIKDAKGGRFESLEMAGISVHPSATNVLIENSCGLTKIPNAYVLCTTRHYDKNVFSESFGKYCVEISNAHDFCVMISRKIATHHKGIKIWGQYNDILYTDRLGVDLQGPSRHIGFIKPRIPYASQREFRFMWTLEDEFAVLEKLDIECPEVIGICNRVA
ncbi:hypothetical protein [Serratia liquefaciens]|uniref:hypothetical protein n=1 Tax=Serratia liquefaciens TaxID=614 RepID=UPI00383036AD